MKGLNQMTALILEEALKDAQRILTDAQNEADTILAEYRQKADAERAAEMTALGTEAGLLIRRAEASAQQIRRNLLLKTKNDLLENAFQAALQALIALDAKERLSIYTAIFTTALESQVRAEQSAMENDLYEEYTAPTCYELMLSEKDRLELGAELTKAASELARPYGKSVTLCIVDVSINGGFILRCGDVELNCGLGGYMEQIRAEIEGEVCQILFS